tara:strand:- start:2402 stop:2818 length:417 start_codon:yes stop_codon:yes gene_type:complete
MAKVETTTACAKNVSILKSIALQAIQPPVLIRSVQTGLESAQTVGMVLFPFANNVLQVKNHPREAECAQTLMNAIPILAKTVVSVAKLRTGLRQQQIHFTVCVQLAIQVRIVMKILMNVTLIPAKMELPVQKLPTGLP